MIECMAETGAAPQHAISSPCMHSAVSASHLSPSRPPRPQPHVSSFPSAVTAAEWNLAAASATTPACRSMSSRMGSAASPVPPVPVIGNSQALRDDLPGVRTPLHHAAGCVLSTTACCKTAPTQVKVGAVAPCEQLCLHARLQVRLQLLRQQVQRRAALHRHAAVTRRSRGLGLSSPS